MLQFLRGRRARNDVFVLTECFPQNLLLVADTLKLSEEAVQHKCNCSEGHSAWIRSSHHNWGAYRNFHMHVANVTAHSTVVRQNNFVNPSLQFTHKRPNQHGCVWSTTLTLWMPRTYNYTLPEICPKILRTYIYVLCKAWFCFSWSFEVFICGCFKKPGKNWRLGWPRNFALWHNIAPRRLCLL